MRFYILLFSTIFFVGCGGTTETVNTSTASNAPVKNTSNTTTVSNNPLETTKPPEAATTNAAPTIAPVMAAYYEALKKKDDAALRKTLSQATLKSYETDMKEEKETSLSKFITDLEPVPDKPFEVRNETVTGDTIIAEVRGGSYPNGIKIKFLKENGEWKKTIESPDVKTSNTTSTK